MPLLDTRYWGCQPAHWAWELSGHRALNVACVKRNNAEQLVLCLHTYLIYNCNYIYLTIYL